jgi:hypothetical protein
MGGRELIALEAVVPHQQPAGEPFVEPRRTYTHTPANDDPSHHESDAKCLRYQAPSQSLSRPSFTSATCGAGAINALISVDVNL